MPLESPNQPAAVPTAGPAQTVSVADASALVAANRQLEAELAATKAEMARTQTAVMATRKSSVISEALSTVPLVPGTAAQVAKLLESDITLHTDPNTGQTVAVGPGLLPAAAHIHAQLSKPEWAHFLQPRNPHGGTAGGSGVQSTPTPAPWAQASVPQSLGEAVLLAAQERTNAPDPRTTGGTALNADGSVSRRPAASFGLKGIR